MPRLDTEHKGGRDMAVTLFLLPGQDKNGWSGFPPDRTGKAFLPLPHCMDHGRLPPLDGQTLATYKDSTRS